MFNTLVIASHNEGKVREIRELLSPFKLKILSAGDVNIPEPEETGKTFAENAELKARHAAAHSKFPALADDSGLAVTALNGAPGIYSARWAGPTKDFAAAFARIQSELGNKNASAYFVCVLSLAMPNGKIHNFEGRIDGKLTFPPRGTHGFGYDPIFIPDGYAITFGEFDPTEKNHISHRARAFEKFSAFLKQGALYA